MNIGPTANFKFSIVGTVVTVTEFSTDPDGTIIMRMLDWGDGTPPTPIIPVPGQAQNTVSHDYGASGNFPLLLMVVDNAFQSGFREEWATVAGMNRPPVPAFTQTISGQTVSFTNQSTDPDGTGITHRWMFGDGQESTEANPVHSYGWAGVFMVNYIVSDGVLNNMATRVLYVGVAPPVKPVADFNFVVNGLHVDLDASASVAAPGKTLYNFNWYFGDLRPQKNVFVPTISYDFAAPGTYSIRFAVRDNRGITSAYVTKSVTVGV